MKYKFQVMVALTYEDKDIEVEVELSDEEVARIKELVASNAATDDEPKDEDDYVPEPDLLQILEDGRITDSAGETMYFSEALIIFTSNLGVVRQDTETGKRYQTITPEMDYDTIQKKLLSTIKDYFKYTIQRPELLNRIGENFIVFNYIRKNTVAEILDFKLNAIISNIEHEKGIKLEIKPPFREYLLYKTQEDLSNGGRGIGNMVDTFLVNPLAEVLIKEN